MFIEIVLTINTIILLTIPFLLFIGIAVLKGDDPPQMSEEVLKSLYA